jgi:hypothetical protein
MHALTQQMDDLGRPAWIMAMILGFVFFWPVGLAILAFMIWSGRMGYGCGASRFERKMARMQDKMNRWRSYASASGYSYGGGTGNAAFDDYRAETLKRLEDEEREFHDFMQRLRTARDKAEFDQFMADRAARATPVNPTPTSPSA